MRAVARSMTLVLAGLLIMGCGDSTAPAKGGSFSGTLSGDLSGSRSGKAEIYDDAEGFGIMMTGSAASGFSFEMLFDSRPTPDTYDAGMDLQAALIPDASGAEYYAVSGTVVITSSSPTAVSGTYDITFESLSGTETVRFKGSFSARTPTVGPIANGTFTATFSGATTGTATGTAFFNVSDGTFVLLMGNSTNTRVIQFAGYGTGRPSPGSYSAGQDGSGDFDVSVVLDADPSNGFFATGGSINVASSSASQLTGTFNIATENFDGETLNVTGSFKATCPGGGC